MKVSDYVFKTVAQTGVKHVFMLPGGGCMHLCDSLGRNPDLTFVCNLHEQACAIAADAYGQYTNNLGVALVTTGPGGTNTLTGVAAAWLDSTPCLFISGQVKRPDMKGNRGVRQMGFQEIDIVSMAAPVTKYAVTVTDPQTIRYHLEKAIYLARHGRPGPAWIDIPLDVQAIDISESELRSFDAAELKEQNPHPEPLPSDGRGDSVGEPPVCSRVAEQIPAADISEIGEKFPLSHRMGEGRDEGIANKVLELLKASKRPVLLVGNGVRLDHALDSFHKLLDVLRIPVLTTWKAIDFLPDNHPLYVGRPGSVGQRGANFTQQNADLLLIVGARLDFGQTGYVHHNFARGAKKVIVDIDPAEIAKLDMKVDLTVAAGARSFLDALRARLVSATPALNFSDWLERCHAWAGKYPVVLPEYRAIKDGVSNYVLLDVLSECMSGEDILVPGSSGACSETTMQAFRVKQGQRIFNSEGLGPMGFGIPAAIGGCLASGGHKTICVDGDGGFAMNIQELEVVRRLNLPIKFFVLDNNGYGSIRQSQKSYFQGRFVASEPQSGLTLPDFNKVAESFGIETCVLRNHDELKSSVKEILGHDRPVVCVVKITAEQTTAPRVASGQRADGSMYSKPLEDLWPFMERREFLDNMIVAPVEEEKVAK